MIRRPLRRHSGMDGGRCLAPPIPVVWLGSPPDPVNASVVVGVPIVDAADVASAVDAVDPVAPWQRDVSAELCVAVHVDPCSDGTLLDASFKAQRRLGHGTR